MGRGLSACVFAEVTAFFRLTSAQRSTTLVPRHIVMLWGNKPTLEDTGHGGLLSCIHRSNCLSVNMPVLHGFKETEAVHSHRKYRNFQIQFDEDGGEKDGQDILELLGFNSKKGDALAKS
jgi:hypothetical protein